MQKYIENTGAKLVKDMVHNGESLKSIKAFCEGYGFDINSYSSPVCYIESQSKLCITIRRKSYYYYI